MSKLIPLQMWAERRLERPPSSRTLRRWIPNIHPRPLKMGRSYYVEPTARYIDPTNPDYLEEVERAIRESSSQPN